MKMHLSRTDTGSLRQSGTHFGLFNDTAVNGKELITEIEDCKILRSTRTENLPRTPVHLS